MGIISFARSLRKNQTDAEAKLWHLLRNRKVKGKKFLRQHPIAYKTEGSKTYSYVADFHCAEKKIIIELDGGIHETQEQADYDKGRDLLLAELGYKVLRFKNEELEDMKKLLASIRSYFFKKIDVIPIIFILMNNHNFRNNPHTRQSALE